MFLLAGTAALLGAFACARIPRNINAPGERLIFRKKYGLFYLLQFLEGWRKQIFIAFAGYMLVKQFNTPVPVMLLLALATQMIGWYVSPLTGKVIDRLGEKPRAVVLLRSDDLASFSATRECRTLTSSMACISPTACCSSAPWR